MVTIKKLSEGYYLECGNLTYACKTLEEIFEHILLHFEGRCNTFIDNSYGKVTIEREKK